MITEFGEHSNSSLQADINEIGNWYMKWSMSLNSKKCKMMHFGRQNPKNKYYVQNEDEKVWLRETLLSITNID